MKAEQPDKNTYISIRCVIPADLEDELPTLLGSWSVLGTEVHENSGDGVGISVYLSAANRDGAVAIRRVLIENGARSIVRESFDGDDWLESYRAQIQAFTVGIRWWIDPHPDQPTAAPPGRQRLVIEPRMAFGTGSHESTQAILMTLEGIEVDGRRVLDVGTGTGILALAADHLGAASVVALDIDETAIWVASETARQQEWTPRVRYLVGPIQCLGGAEFDIVMCNMITSNFLPLLDGLRDSLAPSGTAVFSGLLASEIEVVSTALTEAGFAAPSCRVFGEWASLAAVGTSAA
jgi:ribosomal protein L11 methyltransferase